MVAPTEDLAALFNTLELEIGDTGWWPAETQLEICVGAILTQNTSWKNVESALRNLRNAGIINLQDYLRLDQETLAKLIRPSGYYNQKAKKLWGFLCWFRNEHQGNFLRAAQLKTDVLRGQLLALWGIGPETADAMLCYAFGKPVFVVDEYFRRLLVRHGLAEQTASYEVVQKLAEDALPRNCFRLNKAHAQIVEVAKQWCRKGAADCQNCPLEIHLNTQAS